VPERFTAHRVALRRHPDPETSSDPRVRSVVAALKTLPADAVAPAPAPHFRAELRAQLVAVAPRIIAEEAAGAATPLAPTRTDPAPARAPRPERTRVGFGRPLRVVGAIATVCIMLLGGAVWASQRALPGDALYGLKRATESVRLAFAGSDSARAKLYLGFAGTRVVEARALVERSLPDAAGPGLAFASGRISSGTASYVRGDLDSANADVKAAWNLLNDQALRTRSPRPLDTMRSWVPHQADRLRQLSLLLPAGSLRHRALGSVDLVEHVATLARKTDARLGAAAPSPARHAGAQHHGRHGTGHHAHPATGATTHGAGRSGTGNPPATRSRGAGGASHPAHPSSPSRSGGIAPSLPVPLPTLPTLPTLPSVSLPVSIGSCGISLPVGITIGGC